MTEREAERIRDVLEQIVDAIDQAGDLPFRVKEKLLDAIAFDVIPDEKEKP